jgi:hypothetical protein
MQVSTPTRALRPALLWERLAPGPRVDLRNCGLIVAGWIGVLLLIPPQHEYPIIDDWIYAGSVRDFLSSGIFYPPQWSQANLFGLTLWGAAWVKLFGFSFTVLTYSTLLLAVVALLAFYGVARAVGVPPWGALLGTALLGFNPIFLHLSYSFMTDVPFVALTLVACYCYIRGSQTGGLVWFWEAGLFAGWAYLIRQYGLLIPIAFLGYLVLNSLYTRKWHWPQMLLTAAVPGVFIGGWWLWSHDLPPTGAAYAAGQREALFLFKEPWLRVFLLRAVNILPITALFACAAIKIRPARAWLVAGWAVVMIALILNVDLPTEGWIASSEQPFLFQAGPLAVTIPPETYTFGTVGNIIRMGGIDFFQYHQEQIWTPEVWRVLWGLGVLATVFLLAKLTSDLWDGAKQLRIADLFASLRASFGFWTRSQSTIHKPQSASPINPVVACYLLGLLIFGISLGLTGDLFDRYTLAFLPFVILFVVRGAAEWGRWAWGYSVVALVLLAGFTLLAKADQVDHDNARWQAAQWLAARAGPIHAGFDWNNWVGSVNEAYQISDVPLPSFRVEHQFPYTSRLAGFTTRTVLAESRADVPPLPTTTP